MYDCQDYTPLTAVQERKLLRKYPVIQEIYHDSDGIWITLKSGFNFEFCSQIHRLNYEECVSDLEQVVKGDSQ